MEFYGFEISDTKCNFMALKIETQNAILCLANFGDKMQFYGLKSSVSK
jgi:hypothetical protein